MAGISRNAGKRRALMTCLLCASALNALWLISCSMYAPLAFGTQWTITGTAQFTGAAASAKLAAFSYLKGSGSPASLIPVSTVVTLGAVAGTPTSFSVDIDATGLNPAAGDSIVIQMWDDANGNNQMDDPSQAFCTPLPGDAVFVTTPGCVFVFTGSSWYLGALPIQSATKTGASIASLTPLS